MVMQTHQSDDLGHEHTAREAKRGINCRSKTNFFFFFD